MTRDILTALLINAAVFTLLFCIMQPVRALLLRRGSAVLQYALWAVVVIKLLLPFGFESSLSPLRFLEAADTPAAESAVSPVDTQAALAGLSDGRILPLDDADAQASSQPKAQYPYSQASAKQDAASATAAGVSAAPILAWTDWALAAWVAGVLAAGGIMMIPALRLRRKICSGMAEPSSRVLRILEGCRKELGLRRNVRALTQSALRVPVAAGFLRPVLLLPDDIESRSDVQLRHICLHELMHVKYGDLAVIALLNALCALYWFNPLIWLCFSLVRKDMEAVCDARVLRHIGKEARQEYIGTVLHFAGREKEQRLQAAMGMADGRVPMEQRIRAMFRQGRTGCRTKALALCLAVLMLAVSVLTACQPTPETPIIVGKNQDVMLSAAAQTPSAFGTIAEQVKAPGTYSTNASAADGKLTVSANGTPIDIPDAGSMPIMRVTAADFTQEQVDAMLAAFFDGETLYEVQYGAQTKDEIMQQIIGLRQWKASEEFSSEGDQEQLDEQIAALEKKWEAAPETSEDIVTETDGQLKQREITDLDTGAHIAYYTGISVTTNTKDYTQAATFGVDNNNDMTEAIWHVDTDEEGNVTGGGGRPLRRAARLGYANMGDACNFGQNPPIRVYEDTVIDDSAVLAKLTTTPAQAKALVEQMLATAGIGNMAVVAMYLEDDENLGNYDGLVSPAEHYVYELYLCRTVNGIPVSYIRGSSGNMDTLDEAMKGTETSGGLDMEDFSSIGEWSYETINVMVDDTGIISFDWTSPLNIGETLVQSAALMPFADITAKFEQQMAIEWETRVSERSLESLALTVDYVSLEYQRIAEQNSIESGLLVPVWNFYGTCSAIDQNGEDHGSSYQSGDGVYAYPLMTINAIDGSVIDIMKGY